MVGSYSNYSKGLILTLKTVSYINQGEKSTWNHHKVGIKPTRKVIVGSFLLKWEGILSMI